MSYSDTAGSVRQQYERYPYPFRDPADEKVRLKLTSLDQLPVVNHVCFGGRQSFRRARILVAGGGTGDAAIYLGEQLRDSSARITYLDLSASSLHIAKERANVRGLGNIDFIQGSLLDLRNLAPGPYDYINCSGVLHHLKDPRAGLAALRDELAEEGAMGIMVYALYGRTGIYQLQNLLRYVNKNEDSPESRVRNARRVLSDLPASNWFRRGEDLAVDHKRGEAGIYDLLLHEQDRAYSVPQLHEWLDEAALHFLRFAVFEPHRYRPESYLSDSNLLQRVGELPESRRQAVAELLAGDMTRHVFYCARSARALPSFSDDEMVPFLWGGPATHQQCVDRLRTSPRAPLEFVSRHHTIQFKPASLTLPVFELMDGNHSIGQVVQQLSDRHEATLVRKEMKTLYRVLNQIDLMFLRHESVPAFGPVIAELAH